MLGSILRQLGEKVCICVLRLGNLGDLEFLEAFQQGKHELLVSCHASFSCFHVTGNLPNNQARVRFDTDPADFQGLGKSEPSSQSFIFCLIVRQLEVEHDCMVDLEPFWVVNTIPPPYPLGPDAPSAAISHPCSVGLLTGRSGVRPVISTRKSGLEEKKTLFFVCATVHGCTLVEGVQMDFRIFLPGESIGASILTFRGKGVRWTLVVNGDPARGLSRSFFSLTFFSSLSSFASIYWTRSFGMVNRFATGNLGWLSASSSWEEALVLAGSCRLDRERRVRAGSASLTSPNRANALTWDVLSLLLLVGPRNVPLAVITLNRDAMTIRGDLRIRTLRGTRRLCSVKRASQVDRGYGADQLRLERLAGSFMKRVMLGGNVTLGPTEGTGVVKGLTTLGVGTELRPKGNIGAEMTDEKLQMKARQTGQLEVENAQIKAELERERSDQAVHATTWVAQKPEKFAAWALSDWEVGIRFFQVSQQLIDDIGILGFGTSPYQKHRGLYGILSNRL
ncbi:unnamed protein product [Cuscuta campestris]|uniref:Uncharacterized protein n=1 Tax=Cuscuta campestris TaxID=132261 RepID=A0A484NC42_9ASTE|nr:unnamed protein product [Cuscuta campestris]